MLKYFITLLTLVFVSLSSVAKTEVNVDMHNPNTVLHLVSNQTLARITREKSQLTAQPEYIKVIVEEELIPYFDYKYAAYKVMGRHLKQTTKQQRTEFVEVFKTHLINAYGHILFEFENQTIKIKDNRNYEGKKTVNIQVDLLDENKKLTKLSFKFRKNKKTGEWKAFDVIAEGISLLSTKQSEVGELINKQGIDAVIELLKKKNKIQS